MMSHISRDFKASYSCNQGILPTFKWYIWGSLHITAAVREGEVLRSPDSRHGIDHKTESGHQSGGVAVTVASLLVRTDVAEPRLADTRVDRCDWLARCTKLLWGESRLPDSY